MEIFFFSRKVALCGRTTDDWIWEWVTRGQLKVSAIVRDEGNPFFSRFSWKPVLRPLWILTTLLLCLLLLLFFITCFFPCSCTYIHMWWFFPPMLWLLISRGIHNQQFSSRRMKERLKAYLSIFIRETRVGQKWSGEQTIKHKNIEGEDRFIPFNKR